MAAPVDPSRIVIPFMPSLFHVALAKVAFPFFRDFGFGTLNKAFKSFKDEDGQPGNSAASNAASAEEICNRAKQNLLLVPPHLRKAVLQATHGLGVSVTEWKNLHRNVKQELKDRKFILYWRSDGTVDGNKTAEQLVANPNICIKKRFEIALSYCLEESIRTLWSEMGASCYSEDFVGNSLARIWIPWMSLGPRVHWARALVDFIYLPITLSVTPRFSSCYAFLQPEDIQKYISRSEGFTSDDLRFSLYAMTNEEEVEMVKRHPVKVLSLYLDWPLQALFLEAADRMWNFIDIGCFRDMVFTLLDKTMLREDFDYSELLEGFWKRSPPHLREHEEEGGRMRLQTEAYLNAVSIRTFVPRTEPAVVKIRKLLLDRN